MDGRKNMAEDEEDLSKRLATVLDEIREVMEKRKTRIESLRQEIADIERDNEELEKTIADLLATFN
jgi:phage shock protein A